MNALNRLEMHALHALSDPAELSADEVLDVILARRFGVEYQPIIDLQGNEIFGYQASARFWAHDQRQLSAGRMFARLHENPLLLFYTELEMKKLQISHHPGGGCLMLDLDIDSFFEGGEALDNPFLRLFKGHAWSEHELIVNVVENHNTADALRSQRMIELLQRSGTSVALEDIGVRWGMFSLSAFLDASVVKFNGMALKQLNEHAAEATLDWLVSAARKIGVQTILDGVSSCEELEWAKRMGVDCVQGELFSRQFVRVRN